MRNWPLCILLYILSIPADSWGKQRECGTHGYHDHDEEERDIYAIQRWNKRLDSLNRRDQKEDDASLSSSFLRTRSLQGIDGGGPGCVQCVNIDVHFFLLKDPFLPSGSIYSVSPLLFREQFNFLVNAFSSSPFTFTYKNYSEVDNKWWAILDPSSNSTLREEIGRELRVGGADVLNVFFSDGVCMSNGGFASLPGNHGIYPSNQYVPSDAIFLCNGKVLNVDFASGKALVHQVGHWLGLLDVYEGDSCAPTNLNDFVEDTPQMLAGSTGGCQVEQNSCPDFPGFDPTDNYMDSSDDDCRNRFTDGQLHRMYAEMDLFRRDLEPLGCSPDTEATVSLDVLLDNDPLNKTFYIWDYARTERVQEMGDPTLVDFANKQLLQTFCVERLRPYDLTVEDESMSGGILAPGYYSMTVNGREVVRGGEFQAESILHVFSSDATTCSPEHERFQLDIKFDEEPDDIQWSLVRVDDGVAILQNNLVIEGARLAVDANSTLHIDRCLSPGNYVFQISDSKNNGISSPGYFQLMVEDRLITRGGDFQSTNTIPFRVEPPRGYSPNRSAGPIILDYANGTIESDSPGGAIPFSSAGRSGTIEVDPPGIGETIEVDSPVRSGTIGLVQVTSAVQARHTLPHSKCSTKPFNTSSTHYCTATMPCRPYRYKTYCPSNSDFLSFVKTRRATYTRDPNVALNDGFWYSLIEDKLAAKIFAEDEGIAMPALYFCSMDMDDILTWSPPEPAVASGFVIKPLGLHSSAGIFVLPQGFDQAEVLSETIVSREDVRRSFETLGVHRYIIEEYIPGPTTTASSDEFKVHMFNGQVGSITYIANRGNSCACFVEMDENWNRLDDHGCYRSERNEQTMDNGMCTRIDFRTRQLVSVKGLEMCSETPSMPANLADVLSSARSASERIGVYMRIDLLVDGITNRVLIGEFTPGHTNGSVHCAAKLDGNGCVDPCFLGRLWNENGGNLLHGGSATAMPSALAGWDDRNWAHTCLGFLNR